MKIFCQFHQNTYFSVSEHTASFSLVSKKIGCELGVDLYVRVSLRLRLGSSNQKQLGPYWRSWAKSNIILCNDNNSMPFDQQGYSIKSTETFKKVVSKPAAVSFF